MRAKFGAKPGVPEASSWDFERYRVEKQAFSKALKRQNGEPLQVDAAKLDDLQKIALIDAVRDFHGHDVVTGAWVVEKGTPAQKQKLKSLLGQVDRDPRQAMAQLFDLTYEAVPSSQRPELRGMPVREGQALARRLAVELMRQDLTSALETLGLASSADSAFLSRMQAFRARHAVWEKGIATTAVSAIQLRLPDLRLTEWRELPPEVFAEIRKNGFDSALPLLRDKYGFGKSARFDAAWRAGRATYESSILAYAAYLLASCLRELLAESESTSADAIRASDRADRPVPKDYRRGEYIEAQIEAWLVTYDGAIPSVDSPNSGDASAALQRFSKLADELDQKFDQENHVGPGPSESLEELKQRYRAVVSRLRQTGIIRP